MNLVTLDYTEATAQLQEDGSILCQPESISEKCKYNCCLHCCCMFICVYTAFELPRIHYEKFNGRPYQFVYGLNQTFEVSVYDVDRLIITKLQNYWVLILYIIICYIIITSWLQ